MGGPGGRKGKGEMLQLYYFKNKRNKCNFIMCKLFCFVVGCHWVAWAAPQFAILLAPLPSAETPARLIM